MKAPKDSARYDGPARPGYLLRISLSIWSHCSRSLSHVACITNTALDKELHGYIHTNRSPQSTKHSPSAVCCSRMRCGNGTRRVGWRARVGRFRLRALQNANGSNSNAVRAPPLTSLDHQVIFNDFDLLLSLSQTLALRSSDLLFVGPNHSIPAATSSDGRHSMPNVPAAMSIYLPSRLYVRRLSRALIDFRHTGVHHDNKHSEADAEQRQVSSFSCCF
ncbi:hypothetical protein DL93DRAFT_604523 [Clavulina sp. PMI_390]|nr:hypothetical protein DL93DRAFT_604523 [Clavulina sp. PMI_390]